VQDRSLRWLVQGHRLEYAWVIFAIINLAAMFAIIKLRVGHGMETVPFHFVYISFALMYGFRQWPRQGTVVGVIFVTVTTGLLTLIGITDGWEDAPEFSEVPLMSLMFMAMAYHVAKRQEAVGVAQKLAAERQRDLKRKSQFVSDASHELLTPITIGRGHLDVIMHEPDLPRSELEELCSVVIGELDRMGRVINHLLLLESTGTSGKHDVTRVDAGELVSNVFNRWSVAVERHWVLGELAQGAVELDVDQVTLALDALIENAVQHTLPGGQITISSRPEGSLLAITVADTGRGIPPDDLPRIFDRFYRTDRARNRRHGGAGLGLAIVKAIAEANGGSVSVSSALGVGTSFELKLDGLQAASAGHQAVAPAANSLDHSLGLELTP
jgi:two-component system, OmpR family, sensor kinase